MMPGFLGGGQNAQPKQPFGPQLKQALITAAPMFNAMAAGYSSGRGPYAYMDQGAMAMQEMMKRKREEEAAAAAAAAFGSLAPPGGNAGGTGWGGGSGAYTGSNKAPAPLRADPGVFGGGKGGLTFGREAADTGSVAKGGLSFGPGTGMSGFTRYEAQYGLPEGYLERTAQIESGGNPNAQNPNSSAGGLFQFIDSTAAQYGLQNKFDPAAATDAAARLAADNAAHLRGVLGREPTAAELYLAHQQGAGGAARLLANPNAKAAEIVGADAVRLNGGDLNMTAGEFASKWLGKFGGGGGGGSAGGAVPSGPVDPMTDPYVQRLMQVMAMPGLTPEQRSVVELQLQTRMGQLTAQATPTEYTTFNGPDGTVYRFDKQRGVAEPLTGAEQADPGYRVLTPQEAQAMGLPDGVYQVGPKGEIKPIGGGGTTVNVDLGGGPELGKLSTDYGYVLDPETREPKIDQATGLPMAAPVPGSPAAIEAEKLATKAENTKSQGALKLGTTLESINLNIKEIEDGGLPVTGVMGDFRRTPVGRFFTGDSAMDFGNRSSQVTDAAALAEIQNMRDNSPTGGAVGALTDGERVALGNARTAMNASTSGPEYVRAAKAYRKLALDLAYGEGMWELDENGQPVLVGNAQGATAPITGTTSSGITWSLGE